MPNEHEQVLGLLQQVLHRLDRMAAPLEPALTQKAFAQRIGKHPKTISNWVRSRKLLTQRGLIPASELRKYIS